MDPAVDDANSDVFLKPMEAPTQASLYLEDWSGVSDPCKRRRIQNRLNQREYRKRRRIQSGKASLFHSTAAPTTDHNPLPAKGIVEHIGALHKSDDPTTGEQESVQVDGYLLTQPSNNTDMASSRTCQLGDEKSMTMVKRQTMEAWCEFTTGHLLLRRLPTLLSINVFRALARNAAVLGVRQSWMIYDSVSPFWQREHSQEVSSSMVNSPALSPWASSLTTATDVPVNMHPTDLQKAVEHHPWIDLFPFPRMRDNVLRAIDCDGFDEDDLCYDLVDVDEARVSQKASLIVWGNSLDPLAWEVSEGFIRKWGWILEGCEGMIAATNYWRQKRGEKPFLALPPL